MNNLTSELLLKRNLQSDNVWIKNIILQLNINYSIRCNASTSDQQKSILKIILSSSTLDSKDTSFITKSSFSSIIYLIIFKELEI